MKSKSVVVAGSVAGLMIASTLGASVVATAQESRPAQAGAVCLYMTKGLHHDGGMYTGEFLVVKRSGHALKGYGGALYSEWYDLKGTVNGTHASISTNDPYQPSHWTHSTATWVPSQDRFAGWKRVSKAQMKTYSDGNVPLHSKVCS